MAQSIFTTQTPAILNGNDATAYTLGTEFSRSTDGTITHGRWYFPDPTPTGTTDFVLYAGTGGAAIVRQSFVSPVAGAWNTVALVTPIAYTAGTTLIAAVRTSGMYVATANFFTVDVVNDDITAPAATNGRLDTADQYPGNVSGNHACFFADVIFEPAGGGSHTLPIGQPVEADTATPIGRLKVRTLGQVVETSTAQALTRAKRLTLGQPVETGIAMALAGAPVVLGSMSQVNRSTVTAAPATRAVATMTPAER